MDAPLPYVERRYSAQDGLSLAYREYGEVNARRTPLLCLAGLTRNAKDFHDFAMRHKDERRVLSPDYRGRGRSDWDQDHRNYQPATYVRDVQHLLAASNAHRVVIVGTSLGGILAMMMAVAQPAALAGVVLNDIGPEIDPAGVARIRKYVGKPVALADFDAAAARLEELFGDAYPDLAPEAWRAMAECMFRPGDDGRPVLDYDLAIARAFEEAEPAGDMWPLFGALENIPTMVIHGRRSDLLSAATVDKMVAAKPDLIRVEVPNRGHVPLLDEPECAAALDQFLARF